MSYSHLRGAVRPAAPAQAPSAPHHAGVRLTAQQYNLLCELAPRSDFFASLLRQHDANGCLSPRQAECLVREEVKRANIAPFTPIVVTEHIEAAFARARARGVATPQMYLGDYRLKCASPMSAAAGAIYITKDGVYLGKILRGQWMHTSEGVQHTQAIAALLEDPTAAALAFGQRTGRCAICSRTLTAAESIERTIGPICAAKYGI